MVRCKRISSLNTSELQTAPVILVQLVTCGWISGTRADTLQHEAIIVVLLQHYN